MVWKFRRRGYTGRVEDEKKIQKILDSLNAGLSKPVWAASTGFHASTAITFINGDVKQPIFNPAEGIPVKTFINTETGEIKTYWVKYIVKD